VRSVVIHEVGHYLGFDDDELHRLEREANHPEPA
jgi:predicted Zn-dependent protease with MMP-like domain